MSSNFWQLQNYFIDKVHPSIWENMDRNEFVYKYLHWTPEVECPSWRALQAEICPSLSEENFSFWIRTRGQLLVNPIFTSFWIQAAPDIFWTKAGKIIFWTERLSSPVQNWIHSLKVDLFCFLEEFQFLQKLFSVSLSTSFTHNLYYILPPGFC